MLPDGPWEKALKDDPKSPYAATAKAALEKILASK